MLYIDIRVAVPDHCDILPSHGHRYVYLRTGSRRVEGRLKHSRVAIGRLAEGEEGAADGLLVPNENYYRVFGKPLPGPARLKGRGRSPRKDRDPVADTRPCARACALNLAFCRLAGEAGLEAHLVEAFGARRAGDLLALAAFFARGERRISGLAVLPLSRLFPAGPDFSPAKATALLAGLEEEGRKAFFRAWVARTLACDRSGVDCLDVTPCTARADGLVRLACGCNRDFESLRQQGLALFATRRGRLPLFLLRHAGEAHDAAIFPGISDRAASVGLSYGFSLVTAGLPGQGRRAILPVSSRIPVLGALPLAAHPAVRREVLSWRRKAGSADGKPARGGQGVRAAELPFRLGASDGRLLLYCFPGPRQAQEAAMRLAFNRMAFRLELLAAGGRLSASHLRRLAPFFVEEREPDGTLSFRSDKAAMREELALCGCMALFTTEEGTTPAACLARCRGREALARFLSGEEADPPAAPGDRAGPGRLLVLFLALALRRLLEEKLSAWRARSGCSLADALSLLESLEAVRRGERWSLPEEPCPSQAALVAALDLPLHLQAQAAPSA